MATVRERCSCGARFEVADAPLSNILASLVVWRRTHSCVQMLEDSPVEAIAGGTAQIDAPIGFASGLTIPAKEYDPFEDRNKK